MDQDFSTLINNYFQHDYRDRGIKKWRGFFLSDHTSALKKWQAESSYVEKKLPLMTRDEILHNIVSAKNHYYSVTIQLDEINNEHEFKKNLTGFIKGNSENYIFLEDNKIAIEDIRALIINR